MHNQLYILDSRLLIIAVSLVSNGPCSTDDFFAVEARGCSYTLHDTWMQNSLKIVMEDCMHDLLDLKTIALGLAAFNPDNKFCRQYM